jgi:ADP-ribose pyrophosphatase YjhB (NUDIX family)
MVSEQPRVTDELGKRSFACSPVAVTGLIVNEEERILLMTQAKGPEGWQVVNGAMEAGETILEAVLRETKEEAGGEIRVRPLGTVHISSFHYDEKVRYMLSVAYLLAYEGGTILAGDDMAGSEYRWWSLEELSSPDAKLIVPPGEKWVMHRAVDLYRLWRNEEIGSYRGFNWTVRGKTKR